jgi:uncharacterized protein
MPRHPITPLQRLRRLATGAIALAFLSLVVAQLAQSQTLPQQKPSGYVGDYANVLSQPARDQLTTLCTEVDQKAHAQIAVVTVPTTDGQPIENYTIDLATKWGIGPKQSNRGILILLAVNDHKYWTQVGYGLEAILPDGKVGGFGREAIPFLRQNNYDAALLLMTRRIGDVIALDAGVTLSGQPPDAPQLSQRPDQGRTLGGAGTFILIIVGLIVVFGIMSRGGGSSGRGGGGSAWWIAPLIAGSMGRGGWGGGGFGGGSGGGGGGGFGGFGGGSFGGGGAGGSW